MSWYKQAYNRGIVLMDEYSDGYRPPSSDHKKDPRSLVNAKPEFGGNQRPGYPRDFSQDPDNEDDPQWAKLHGTIPGEAVLMDDPENDLGKPGDSDEGLGERFTAQDEFNTDNDRTTLRDKELDNIDVGPHNMQNRSVFHRMKDKIKTRGIRI
jgi:hypothetical protein